MLQKIRGKSMQKVKGQSTMDLAIYIVIASLILLVGSYAYGAFRDRVARNNTNSELATLAEACIVYQADNVAGTPPANLGALVTGLTAAQSIDGVAKGTYVTKTTWTNDPASFVDGWGNAYQYSTAARTITSTNNGNTAIVKAY